MDQGWPTFAIAHNIHIGFFLTFKKISPNEFRLVIFDYSCSKVVKKCHGHEEPMRRIIEEVYK
jgi:hypothetical protein